MIQAILDIAQWTAIWYGALKLIQHALAAMVRSHLRHSGHNTELCDFCSGRVVKQHIREVLRIGARRDLK